MKKSIKISLFLILGTFLLNSCFSLFNIRRTSTSSDNDVGKKLLIKGDFKKEYLEYESLDLSGMEVYEVDSQGERLTNLYYIEDQEGQKVGWDYSLEKVGDFTFYVKEDGYDSASFNISVKAGGGKLEIETYPSNLSYNVGDTLSLAGMEVVFEQGDELLSHKTTVDDYQAEIIDEDGNKSDAQGYVFRKEGTYKVIISYERLGSTYEASFSVFCQKEGNTLPEELGGNVDLMKEDSSSAKVKISRPSSSGSNEYYPSSKVKVAMTMKDYGERSYLNWSYTPSVGKTPLLVIPAIIPGYENYIDLNKAKTIINKTFFGSSDQVNFESLHSYYYKSSFGKLDFTGKITDFYRPDQNEGSKFKNASDFTQDKIGDFAQEAVDWATEKYDLNLDAFDTDDNGTVDGVWIVYIHPTDSSNNSDKTFWAYSSTTQKRGSVSNPVVNNYGWAGIDFIDGKYQSGGNNLNSNPDKDQDAHVLIHETGHMLGLPDYYSYGDSNYSPLGRIDMMDNNVGDHNSYSKMVLGWITPTIVYGNATVDLKTITSKDSFLVIPYDSKQYKKDSQGNVLFNPFDEYLVVDFYTYDDSSNLNNLGYWGYNINTIKGKGIRIYHVDNRLMEIKYNGYRAEFPSDPDEVTDSSINDLYEIITNTESGLQAEESIVSGNNALNNAWDQLRWISADKKKLATKDSNGNIEAQYVQTGVNNPISRLFKSGMKFDIDSYSASFVNGAFDNEEVFTSSIVFLKYFK